MRPVVLCLALLAVTGAGSSATDGSFQTTDALFTRNFSAKNFIVHAEDLTLTLREGTVLLGEDRGITTLALVGNGSMRFAPPIEAEKSQMRLLGGRDALESSFDVVVLRVVRVEEHADLSQLVSRAIDASAVRRINDAFPDLRLSASATPTLLLPTDVIADIRTKRFDSLRYRHSSAAPEAISLIRRTGGTTPSIIYASGKTLSIYPSAAQRAARGGASSPESSEARNVDYDVLHHDLSIVYDPERRFIEGTASMRVTITAPESTEIAFRLAETLVVRSVSIPGVGNVSAQRTSPQDPLIVRLPAPLPRGAEITIVVSYSGAISPPTAEWEMPQAAGTPRPPAIDHAQLTSTLPMWYPRPLVIDYATASMRISVPAAFDCVATGELDNIDPSTPGRKVFTFTARQPVRHLAFLVAPFTTVSRVQLTGVDGPPGKTDATGKADVMPLVTVMQPRARVNGAATAATAADIVQFYRSLVGDVPYPSLTLALVDGQIPGGHSAAYLSIVGAPPPGTTPFWRDDPAAYDAFPDFILAHELAHQWWGHVVGWGSYHDQWMMEAFAQYFAALYSEHRGGPQVLRDVLTRMRSWTLRDSAKGPLSLGPRLGEALGDDSVFRSLLYNKGPAVLHTLRRLIGDAFFDGVQRFQASGRFRQPSTADLRAAMEQASGRSLSRFFEQWIEGSTLPRVKFSYRVEPGAGSYGEAVLRLEQIGEIFDVPVTIVLRYDKDQPSSEQLVGLSDRVTEVRVPLKGRLRRAEVSRSDGTLVDVR